MTSAIYGNAVAQQYEDTDATTGFTAISISAVSLEEDVFFQGVAGVSSKSSKKLGSMYYDWYGQNSNTYLDFTSGGNMEGNLVGIWISIVNPKALETLANFGLSVRLWFSNSETDYADWLIAGSNDLRNFRSGKGGYVFFALDPTLPPSRTSGTVDLDQVSYIGISIDTAGSAKAENIVIDGIVLGSGIQITGTTDWLTEVDYTTDYTNRGWGFLEYDDTGEIIYSKGKIIIGDTGQGANTSLTDTGKKIVFTKNEYYRDGNWFPMVKDDYLGIFGEDHASWTTTFTDGTLQGTDEGTDGSLFLGDPDVRCVMDFSGLSANAGSLVKLYGSIVERFTGAITFKNDVDWENFSVTYTACGIVDYVGAVDVKNCIFKSTADMYLRTWDEVWVFNTNATSYTDETTDANDAGAGDVALNIATHTTGDIVYFGHQDQFGSIEMTISTPDAGSPVIVWEYWDGGSWTALASVIDGTAAFTVDNVWDVGMSSISKISYTWPSDWATTTVNGGSALYFVRARYTTAGTAGALADQIWANTVGSGSALLYNSSWDVDDSAFNANAHAENTAHGIQHDASTSINYNSLIFSGNDADVHFTPASGDLTITKVDTADPSSSDIEGSGAVSFVGSETVSLTVIDADDVAIEDVLVTFYKATNPNFLSGSGNNAGDGDFVISSAPTNIPASGWFSVTDVSDNGHSEILSYRYTSWTGSTLTLLAEITGTATSLGSSTILNCTSTDFTAIDLIDGDTIRNTVDGSVATVVRIIDADTIETRPLSGGTDDTWDNLDTFSIHRLGKTYVNVEDKVDIPILQTYSDGSGIATGSYPGSVPLSVLYTAKKSSDYHSTKYRSGEGSGSIVAVSGLTPQVTLEEDTVQT